MMIDERIRFFQRVPVSSLSNGKKSVWNFIVKYWKNSSFEMEIAGEYKD